MRGSHLDLVQRLSHAVETCPCAHFVRAFGNYPLLDVNALAALVESHLETDADYSYNDHQHGVPWGMGCEAIATRTLRRLQTLDLNAEQRQIGTLYIRQNPDAFHVNRWTSSHAHPEFKLVFETHQDLALLRDVVAHVPDPDAESVARYLLAHPVLLASNKESPSKEVGLEKLFLHPGKIAILRASATGRLDASFPISVELSLTNRCNLGCVYCSDRGLRTRAAAQPDLAPDVLCRLFDELDAGGTQGIVLEGGGEPTMHADFAAITRHLQTTRLSAGLITNGAASLAPELLAAFQWIRVSLDASTAPEWRALKGRDLFNQVLSNLRDYAQHCPTVGVGFVVTNNNTSEIDTLVLRVRQHGVAYIQLRPVVDAPELYPTQIDLSYLLRYQTQSFSVLLDGMYENGLSANAGLPCRAHSLTTVVSADGSVYLCGRLNIHPWLKPIGNICEQSFREIWEGVERHRQARQVRDPDFCRQHCPPCRLTAFNRLLHRLDHTRTPHFI